MLQAYELLGQKVGVDIAKYQYSNINGNPPFIFNDVLQTNYADITSINNIYNFGHVTGKDFKFIRDQAKHHVRQLGIDNSTEASDPAAVSKNENDAYRIVATSLAEWAGKEGQIAIWQSGAWTYLDGSSGTSPIIEHGYNFIPTTEEKLIAATWLIGSVSQQITAFAGDFDAKIKAQSEYALKVQDVRVQRYKKAVASIHSKIPTKALETLDTLGLRVLQYKNEGLDGLFYNKFGELDGDFAPTGPINGGLGCWINSLGFFAGTGLKDKDATWNTLDGQTPAQYAAELNGLLFVNGLY